MDLRYGAAVIFICIITPIAFGFFIWPADSEDTSEWGPSDQMVDITSNLKITDVPNTSPYNGTNNNLFLFDADDGSYVRETVERTTVKTAYAHYSSLGSGAITSGDMEAGTHDVTVSDVWEHFYSLLIENSAYADYLEILFWSGPGNNLIFEYGGKEYDTLMMYTNGRAQLVNASTGELADVTDVTFTYSRSGFTLVNYLGKPANGGSYVSIDSGFAFRQTSESDFVWTNGYVNHGATVLLKLDPTYEQMNMISFGDSENTLYLQCYNGNLIIADYSSSGMENVTLEDNVLGSTTAYEYLLLLISPDYQKLTVYGLTGMDGFTDTYTNHLGNNLSFDLDIDEFTSIHFKQGAFNYYVASTTIESGTIKAISDESFAPVEYYADNEWMVSISNPSVIGDSITFSDGLTQWSYPISGGSIQIVLGEDTEPSKVPVRNMLIAHISGEGETYTTYINGKEYANNVQTVTLGGTWLTNVLILDVEWTESQSFAWVSGGFGLDMQSFCVVGLVTSVACFLFLGFAYRKEGWGDEFGMLVAILSGAFYLMILMS